MPTVFRLTALGVLFSTLMLFSACQDRLPTDMSPSPDFEVSPKEGWSPLLVQFRDTTHAGNSKIHAWYWEFGDGTTGTGPAVSHAYLASGSYDVTLTVTSTAGNFSETKRSAVTVKTPGAFGEVDQKNGLYSAQGMALKVSEPFRNKVKFGIERQESLAGLDMPADLIAVSDVFTVMHNLPDPDFFILDVENESLSDPLYITVPLHSNPKVPIGDGSDLYLMAFLEDGRIVPIPGSLTEGHLTSVVLRLPSRARYVIVKREGTIKFKSHQAGVSTKSVKSGKAGWGKSWQIHSDAAIGQMLAALHNGSMENAASFLRRDWSAQAVERAYDAIAAAVTDIYDDLSSRDLRPPLLLAEKNVYDLLFYDMLPAYDEDLTRANQTPFFDNFFGHLVINQAVLLDLTRRNAQLFVCDPSQWVEYPLTEEEEAEWYGCDFNQAFGADTAFAEAMLQTIYGSYTFPNIKTAGDAALNLPVPAPEKENETPRAVYFYEGLLDSYAVYFGQSRENWPARAFGDNERPLYSQPLFFPYHGEIAGYSPAGQEFIAWLQNSGYVQDPMELLPWALEGMSIVVQELSAYLARPLTFTESQMALALTLDRAILEYNEDEDGEENDDTEEIGLPEYYWEYVKDNLFENSDSAKLRPSDQNRKVWSLNLDRLEEEAIIDILPAAPVERLDILPEDYPALNAIAPLSTRVIRLQFSELTTDLYLDFRANKWRKDNRDNAMGIAVYIDGYPGINLSDAPGEYGIYTLIDSDGDGVSDIIQVTDHEVDQEHLLSNIVLLVSNLNPTQPNSLEFALDSFAELVTPDSSVLHRYVYAPDPAYGYEVTDVLPSLNYTAYRLSMTSGSWRGGFELEDTVWQHKMAIVVPRNVTENTAMLLIAGGSASSVISPEELGIMADYAIISRAPIVLLKQTPFQPLNFFDDGTDRTEDAIIAYSFDKYMQSYQQGAPDPTWPALLPMTRSAVRAMDTAQDFLTQQTGNARSIERFVVGGASKRGWTTWLTAAVDDRVCAIIPMVIDILKMDEQIAHHAEMYKTYPATSVEHYMQGGYSTSLKDYVEFSIFNRFDTAAGRSLLGIIDPFYYRESLQMPKLILNSTGDQFFLPDGSEFYFGELGGLNYLSYLPNTDHSLGNDLRLNNTTSKTMLAFFIAQARNSNAIVSDNVEVPHYSWTYGNAGNKPQISTHASVKPIAARQWTATVQDHRDFRLRTQGEIWKPTDLKVNELDGTEDLPESFNWTCLAEITPPTSGWTAFMTQLVFTGPEDNTEFTFSTPVRIISAEE